MSDKHKPAFTQVEINRLITQMFKSYKAYHTKVREYSKKDRDVDDIPSPVYTLNEDLNSAVVAMMIHLEELEDYTKKNDHKWNGMLKEFGESYAGKLIEEVAKKNAEANATLFLSHASSVATDVETLGDDHENDE